MLLGFVTLLFFIIVCLRAIDKRLFKKPSILTKIHVPVSIGLIAALIVHIIMTVPLLGSRPIPALLTGGAGAVLIALACNSAVKKNLKFHRVSVIIAALLIALHIAFNLIGVADYQNKVRNTVISDVDLSKTPDGVYTG